MQKRFTLKSDEEIELMRAAGLLLWKTHIKAKEFLASGITTAELDAEVERFILSHNATPIFKGVPGEVPYPATTCISVNEEIVHGIPGKRILQEGDIVSIDIGLRLDGWCADCACTHAVGEVDEASQKLMQVTEECLGIAIREISPGLNWSSIARIMGEHATNAGFTVVEELIGHGIGRDMWELPDIPNFFSRRIPDFKLRPGMVIAVEPMINSGKRHIDIMPDHWTISTRDKSRSAHFEHCIAVTKEGARVLTCGPNGEGWALG